MDDGWRWALTGARAVSIEWRSMALELKEQGTTFTVRDCDLVAGGDPDTTYTLRYFTADDADRLRRQATVKKLDPETRTMVDEFDPKKYALAILDYVIADWSGIVRDGQPLPCVLDNKRVLPAARREKLLLLSQENVEVKAQQQAESFPETSDVR